MKLTQRQREIIAEVTEVYGHTRTFAPRGVYPCRNSVDNGKRRVLMTLDRKGYFEQVDISAGEATIVEHIRKGGRRYRLRLPSKADTKCPICYGHGYIKDVWHRQHVCQACDGTGEASQ